MTEHHTLQLRNVRRRRVRVLGIRMISVLLVLCGLVGCASDSASLQDSAGDFDAPGDMHGGGGEGACIVKDGVDSDNDGLLDIYEDLNRNCLVDEGETDPYNPDSDGDGLLDGDEDADGNGVWDADRGELNPLLRDTDGNGVPDAEEPKAQVCNRAHAERALAERRMLPSNGVLYLHSGIKDAAPFGESDAVFLVGHEDETAGIIFDSQLDSSMFRALIGTLSEGLFAPDEESYIELRDVYENTDRGTVEAHLRLKDHQLSLETIVEFLAEYVPSLNEPMALNDSYRATKTDWDVQLQGEQLEDGTRWAISWKPADASAEWFSIVRPRMVGVDARRTIRFVCENVDVRSRTRLNVLLVMDEDAVDYGEYWIQTLGEMVQLRAQRGSTTQIHALRSKPTGGMSWESAEEAVEALDIEGLTVAFEDYAFDQRVSAALQSLPETLEAAGEDVLVLVLSGRGTYDADASEEPLPMLPSVLQNARMVVASPTQEPFDCDWRMSDSRATAVERLIAWGHARHIGNCNSSAEDFQTENHVLMALSAVRWHNTERAPIPGTLRIADGDRSVEARTHSVAGTRVILAPNAVHNKPSAVSFVSWFE